MLNVSHLNAASLQPGHSLECLRSASLFANLSDRELGCFDDAAHPQSYEKGDFLYLKDEPAEFFYVIQHGWIKLFHDVPTGEEVIVDMLTAGQMAGESAVFENCRHTSNAEVIEPAQLFSIPSKLLTEQMCHNPRLARSMLSSMSQHHRRHYGRIALNAMQNAPQRIGCFLLRLCPAAQKRHIVFRLPYDKTLIAETLGMNAATFSRTLNVLREKTGVHITGSRVEIDSGERLAKFVYGSLAQDYLASKQQSGQPVKEIDDFGEVYTSAYSLT